MRDEEYNSLHAALARYNSSASEAESARDKVRGLVGDIRPAMDGQAPELRALHEQLLETVRQSDLAAQLARGALGVVVAVRGLNEPAPATNVPYSPPPDEDYIGT